MKARILFVLLCGLVVAILAMATSAQASVTERELRSAQQRLGMTGGRYVVSVVPDSVPNAGARPGGDIRVTAGMMAFAADEDEIAGVLAHEKGHVDQNHFRSFDEAAGVYYGSAVAAKEAGASRGTTDIISGGLTLAFLQRRMFRGEYRADEYAKKQLAMAGYRPDALETLFARLKGQKFPKGSGDNTFCFIGFAGLKSHPSFEARISALRGGRQLEQQPLRPVGPVGPVLIVVENRLRYAGSSGFFIWTRPGRIWPGYGYGVVDVIAPAMTDQLVSRGFDVVEIDQFDAIVRELDARHSGRFDATTLAEVGKLVGASHIIVVALTDDQTASTGNVEIRSGQFGRQRVEVEAANRRLKLSSRLIEVQSRLIVWTSAKMGNEAALAGSYSNFGFFNGQRIEAAKTQPGKAVESATKKIAEALRKDVTPAVSEHLRGAPQAQQVHPKGGTTPDAEGLATPTATEPATAKPAKVFTFNLAEGSVSLNEQIGLYDSQRRLVGWYQVTGVNSKSVSCLWVKGKEPIKGSGMYFAPLPPGFDPRQIPD